MSNNLQKVNYRASSVSVPLNYFEIDSWTLTFLLAGGKSIGSGGTEAVQNI